MGSKNSGRVTANTVGQDWADEVRDGCVAGNQKLVGPFPGTLSEAVARSSAFAHPKRMALKVLRAAKSEWSCLRRTK